MTVSANISGNNYSACWKSPSNIALIKYWGKKGIQIPSNSSLSVTLDEAYTITRVSADPVKAGSGPIVSFRFEGELNHSFGSRIQLFLKSIIPHFDFLKDMALNIESGNNFPHSAGIASSASAMSALSLCLCSIEEEIMGVQSDREAFLRKASYISRLGSGSACRSVYGNFAVWGKHSSIKNSADDYAVTLPFEPNDLFTELHDTILIVDPGTKKVSSSVGHNLMKGHVYAEARFSQAEANLSSILIALQQGDWETFATIIENEALSLHAMMMTSKPGYVLMHPNSLKIIEKVIDYRKQSGLHVCFTLDAGPNVHLLYPERDSEKLKPLIEELKDFCFNRTSIYDKMGRGPVKLNCK
ncbi:MAG: diphosphomevalonate decarboxylase [Bacteroidetes bacterium HGW-Bacteroidetes-9]|nr:MAG: diphosphomevalonate decarboxylase [Bacteroidetes bacterium HGW-Bacteroidetes-9]